MTPDAFTFLTYLWHYLVARLLYDQLVRPVVRGHLSIALLTCCVGGGAFVIGRWSGRRNARRAPRFKRRGRS
jgi:hypothetical protein